jgi:hypothetical protein
MQGFEVLRLGGGSSNPSLPDSIGVSCTQIDEKCVYIPQTRGLAGVFHRLGKEAKRARSFLLSTNSTLDVGNDIFSRHGSDESFRGR